MSPPPRLEPIRRHAGGIRIQRQPVLQRRKGAAAAIRPVAQPARQPDAHLGAFQIDAVRIGHLLGVRRRCSPSPPRAPAAARPSRATAGSRCARSTDTPRRPAVPPPAPALRRAARRPYARPSAGTIRHSARTEIPRRRTASTRCPPDRRAGRRTARRARPAAARWTADGTPVRTTRRSAPPAPPRRAAAPRAASRNAA